MKMLSPRQRCETQREARRDLISQPRPAPEKEPASIAALTHMTLCYRGRKLLSRGRCVPTRDRPALAVRASVSAAASAFRRGIQKHKCCVVYVVVHDAKCD